MSTHSQEMQEATNVDTNKTGKVTFRKLVIPFDLEKIFAIQYDVSGLKLALEWIIENLGEHNEQ